MEKAKLIKKTRLTESVIELSFETENKFNFKAGQFVTIKIDDNLSPPCFRAYSIASIPKPNSKIFDLCIKVIENGRGSNWLNNLKIKNTIKFVKPSGKLTFNKSKKHIIFITAGVGAVPFKSIIENELKNKNPQKMHLLFGLRHIKDIFYKDFFEKLAKKHKNFNFDLILSQPENNEWKGETGRVTDILKNSKLDPRKTEAYICGLKNMIYDTKKILQKKGIRKIHTEMYN